MSDQMSSYYTCLRKTIKWYKKAVFEIILGTAVVNTWVMYKKNTRQKIDMLAFRELLIKALLADENQQEIEDEADIPAPATRRASRSTHKLSKIEGIARTNRKRCVVCYERIKEEKGSKEARAKTKRVMTYCDTCDNKPAMCLDCFNEKHT